jgi:DNA-binding response OmpR family regulator
LKLFCLSEDKALGAQVCAEAARLNWDTVFVNDRGSIAQAMGQCVPDLFLIEVNDLADLEWWKDVNVSGNIPVIFLNQEISEEFMTKGLEYGADGFLPKSLFSPRHFEARVRSIMRRQRLGQNKRFVASLNMMVDSEHYSVEINGKALALTLTEFKILRELASDERKVVSRFEIQTRVFGHAAPATRSLDVHVCSLRKKIRFMGLDIDSVRGVGYQLNHCAS